MGGRAWLEQTRPTGHGRARGLVSSRPSGSRVEAMRFHPPPTLAEVVEAFWIGRWDLPDDAPHTTRLLSDPCAHVVLEHSGGEQRGARLVGVWTTTWERRLEGRGRALGAKIRAGAIRAFFDEPAHQLTDAMTALSVGPLFTELEQSDDPEALDGLADWLEQRRRPADPKVAEAVALVQAIVAGTDIMRVDALAAHAATTKRALQRLFRDYVGASPKWVIRRHRLQEAALAIERGDALNLADLAARLGYADQAHLARDFRQAVGKPPSAFAVEVHQ